VSEHNFQKQSTTLDRAVQSVSSCSQSRKTGLIAAPENRASRPDANEAAADFGPAAVGRNGSRSEAEGRRRQAQTGPAEPSQIARPNADAPRRRRRPPCFREAADTGFPDEVHSTGREATSGTAAVAECSPQRAPASEVPNGPAGGHETGAAGPQAAPPEQATDGPRAGCAAHSQGVDCAGRAQRGRAAPREAGWPPAAAGGGARIARAGGGVGPAGSQDRRSPARSAGGRRARSGDEVPAQAKTCASGGSARAEVARDPRSRVVQGARKAGWRRGAVLNHRIDQRTGQRPLGPVIAGYAS
jgi:hypothetical protein